MFYVRLPISWNGQFHRLRITYILRTDDRPTDDQRPTTDRLRILENFEWPYLGNGSSDRLCVHNLKYFLCNRVLLLARYVPNVAKRSTWEQCIYKVAPKNWHNILYALTLPNINRFSKFFHVRIRRKFVITLSLKIPPHLRCIAILPCVLQKHHDAAFFLQGQDLLFKAFYLLVHLM